MGPVHAQEDRRKHRTTFGEETILFFEFAVGLFWQGVTLCSLHQVFDGLKSLIDVRWLSETMATGTMKILTSR